tara:strand:+ start:1536 stop:3263 length:1728 start_codon:yes stop_codon:yes gene_type:complete
MAKVSTRADMALIQGAKAVGESMMPADLSGLDKVTKAGTDMAVGAIDEIAKKEQVKVDAWEAFGKDAEQVMLDGGSLGKALYEDTVNFTKELKNDYLAALKSGDTAAAFAAKKGLQDRSAFTQEHKEIIKEISSLRNPEAGELGLSKSHTEPQLKTMGDIIAGRYTVGKNDKGELTYKTESGTEITNAEFKDMYVTEHLETGKKTGELIQNVGKSSTFNEIKTRDEYERTIPKTIKEYRASMFDDLGGQGGENNLPNLLKKDFKDGNLEKEIMSALGQEGYNKFDTDGTPGLSEEEKNNFINAVTDTEDPNFDLNTSRTIFVDKMVNVVKNKHTEHWKGVADANTAKILEEDRQLRLKNTLAKGLDDNRSSNRINEALVDAEIKTNEVVQETSQEVDKAAAKVDLVNTNWKKGDPAEEKNLVNVSTDQLKAITEGINDPNMRGVVGNFGYYYKDGQGDIRQFKNKQDFIKKQKIKQKDGESEDQAIARFNAKKGSTGIAGGKATSIATITADEQLNAAKDQIIDKTSTKSVSNKLLTPVPAGEYADDSVEAFLSNPANKSNPRYRQILMEYNKRK